MIGKTDFDLFSESFARAAQADEQEIMRTGQPIIGKVEREEWPDGRATWSLTNKMPLRDGRGAIVGTFGLGKDLTKSKEMEVELEKAHRDLIHASHLAGMAEVATSVLHNVGNVLNSINVSASVIAQTVRNSRAESLARLATLVRGHQGDLGEFFALDAKGKLVPQLLDALSAEARQERERLLAEIDGLRQYIDHIKEIVSTQQAYATTVGVVEPIDAAAVMDDSLRMNSGALIRHQVRVDKRYQSVPPVFGQRAKILQILVNLIHNAKYACDARGTGDGLITLAIEPTPAGRVRLIVRDNGIGIPPQNMKLIFSHGFTTRPNGHGFGLHSAVNAAREMDGELSVASDGTGKGATFTLEMPAFSG
jgi:signal transduction histidine kinase